MGRRDWNRARWEDHTGHVWEVRTEHAMTPTADGGERWSLVAIEVRCPHTPPHPLPADLLAKVRTAPEDVFFHVEVGDVTIEPDGSWSPVAIGKPQRYGMNHYRRVARVYLAAKDARKRPRQAVMADLGVSERTASRHIDKARALGLLPPLQRGRKED